MRKCVITGQDTISRYANIPVSVEGRKFVQELRDSTNNLIIDKILDSMKEKAEEKGDVFEDELIREYLVKTTTKLGLKTTLTALNNGDKVAVEALKSIIGESNE